MESKTKSSSITEMTEEEVTARTDITKNPMRAFWISGDLRGAIIQITGTDLRNSGDGLGAYCERVCVCERGGGVLHTHRGKEAKKCVQRSSRCMKFVIAGWNFIIRNFILGFSFKKSFHFIKNCKPIKIPSIKTYSTISLFFGAVIFNEWILLLRKMHKITISGTNSFTYQHLIVRFAFEKFLNEIWI